MGCGGGKECGRVCVGPWEEENHCRGAFGCGGAGGGQDTFEVVLESREGGLGCDLEWKRRERGAYYDHGRDTVTTCYSDVQHFDGFVVFQCGHSRG